MAAIKTATAMTATNHGINGHSNKATKMTTTLTGLTMTATIYDGHTMMPTFV